MYKILFMSGKSFKKEKRDCFIEKKTFGLFNKIYSESFAYFPREIKDMLIERLTKYAEVMNDEEEKYLENWDMT